MILTALIVGAALAGVVIAVFWRQTIEWLKKAIQKIKEVLNRVVMGTEVFLKRIANGFQEYSYQYSKLSNGQIERTMTIKKEAVSESEIPDDIKEQARLMKQGSIANVTTQFNEQLLKLQQ